MRIASAQHRAYTYKVITPPTGLPVSVELFKKHANITHSINDDIIAVYLGAATSFAEAFTRRDLITRTYETYRDFFPNSARNEGYYTLGHIPGRPSANNVGFEIRRSPLQVVTSIEYLNNALASIVVDPSTYYFTKESDYSEVVTKDNASWPSDLAPARMQSIKIEFNCGIGDTDADIPFEWKLAIMEHAMLMYANRGDCSSVSCGGTGVPSVSRSFYLQNRIENL